LLLFSFFNLRLTVVNPLSKLLGFPFQSPSLVRFGVAKVIKFFILASFSEKISQLYFFVSQTFNQSRSLAGCKDRGFI